MKRLRLLVLFVVLFISASYFFGTSRDGRQSLVSDNIIVMMFSPIARATRAVVDSVGGFLSHYVILMNASQENDFLKNEIIRLKLQEETLVQELGEKFQDSVVRKNHPYLHHAFIEAKVLGFDPFVSAKTIWINVGKKHGALINSVVIAERGLAGRVIQTFTNSSKVLLVIDDHFSVDAKSVQTGKRCLVRGLQPDAFLLEPLPFLSHIEFQEGREEFVSGEELVTTGLGGIYPEGIAVGTVVFADKTLSAFKRSLVLPAVDFTKISRVYVLHKLTVEN